MNGLFVTSSHLMLKKKQIVGPSKKDDILLVLSKLNLNN